ncbi:MAG: hypothetical protein QG646_1103 [Euryarchaeota archaeon]|nr:hypothetical protein [Euryarchaeota archaeon]
MQNPSYQIDVYLRDTAPKWAILTSGRYWRLYHETTSYKLDYYYEVDLPSLLAGGDIENFKYFYLFFRREAFGQTVDGGCFLDRVREESVAYAQEIGEDLKENVYRAMKILAQGFLAEAATGAAGPDQQAVGRAAESSMRLLYRLLFIFYAESRSLLDINNRYYYELSLQKLKAERQEAGDQTRSPKAWRRHQSPRLRWRWLQRQQWRAENQCLSGFVYTKLLMKIPSHINKRLI